MCCGGGWRVGPDPWPLGRGCASCASEFMLKERHHRRAPAGGSGTADLVERLGMTLFPANRAGGGGQGERVRAAAIAGGQKGCDKSAAAGPQVLPPASPLPPKSTQDSLAGSGDAEDVITSACLALRILRPGATARRKDDILTYRTITTTTRCTIISTHRTEERL